MSKLIYPLFEMNNFYNINWINLLPIIRRFKIDIIWKQKLGHLSVLVPDFVFSHSSKLDSWRALKFSHVFLQN